VPRASFTPLCAPRQIGSIKVCSLAPNGETPTRLDINLDSRHFHRRVLHNRLRLNRLRLRKDRLCLRGRARESSCRYLPGFLALAQQLELLHREVVLDIGTNHKELHNRPPHKWDKEQQNQEPHMVS